MNPLDEKRTDQSDKKRSIVTLEEVKKWYRGLPDKKRYLEFVTALLTIPVLLTVLISNLSNIKNQGVTNQPSPTVSPSVIIERVVTPGASQMPTAGVANPTPLLSPTVVSATNTPTAQCTPQIGPIDISYPENGTTISRDPICLIIPRTGVNYCSVVWSYRINGEAWSDYTDREICMYGLGEGSKKLDLRVKSIVSGEEKILTRTFSVVRSPADPTPATSSGSITQ